MSRRNRLATLATALTIALTVFVRADARTVRVPSRFVPGDGAISAAVKDQTSPFLCQGGTTVLAVWSDNRANSTGGYEGETSWDIYGMRFDSAGNPLETVPFAIAAGPAAQKAPRASWNGTNWLVVFESVDFNGTGYYLTSLEALRVVPDGRVLDPKPIKLYNMTPGPWAVASDGSEWVVGNQGTPVNNDVVAARISSAGVLLDPGPRSLQPAIAYGADRALPAGTPLEFTRDRAHEHTRSGDATRRPGLGGVKPDLETPNPRMPPCPRGPGATREATP